MNTHEINGKPFVEGHEFAKCLMIEYIRFLENVNKVKSEKLCDESHFVLGTVGIRGRSFKTVYLDEVGCYAVAQRCGRIGLVKKDIISAFYPTSEDTAEMIKNIEEKADVLKKSVALKPIAPKPFYSTSEIAEILGVDRVLVANIAKKHHLKSENYIVYAVKIVNGRKVKEMQYSDVALERIKEILGC